MNTAGLAKSRAAAKAHIEKPWSHDAIATGKMSKPHLEKWTDCIVASGREPVPELFDEFERVLADANDERPLQKFLAGSPAMLGPLAPPGGTYWCLDRPRLGAEYVPDFLLATATSVGINWVAVELENPNAKALTQAGLPAAKLADALRQVRDWRTWLTDNVAYARNERGLKDIDANCRAFVVIGRRNGLPPRQVMRYRGLSEGQTTVMSYDRLRDTLLNAISR